MFFAYAKNRSQNRVKLIPLIPIPALLRMIPGNLWTAQQEKEGDQKTGVFIKAGVQYEWS